MVKNQNHQEIGLYYFFQCILVLDDNINLYFQLIVIREAIKYKFQLPIMPCGRGRLHKFTGF